MSAATMGTRARAAAERWRCTVADNEASALTAYGPWGPESSKSGPVGWGFGLAFGFGLGLTAGFGVWAGVDVVGVCVGVAGVCSVVVGCGAGAAGAAGSEAAWTGAAGDGSALPRTRRLGAGVSARCAGVACVTGRAATRSGAVGLVASATTANDTPKLSARRRSPRAAPG